MEKLRVWSEVTRFKTNQKEMNTMLDEVKSSVSNWQRIANQIGIPRSEQTIMADAFRMQFSIASGVLTIFFPRKT